MEFSVSFEFCQSDVSSKRLYWWIPSELGTVFERLGTLEEIELGILAGIGSVSSVLVSFVHEGKIRVRPFGG